MTSPQIVLFLALALSTYGTPNKPIADYGTPRVQTSTLSINTYSIAKEIISTKNTWTNAHNNMNRHNKKDVKHKYDDIYTENEDLQTKEKKIYLRTIDDKNHDINRHEKEDIKNKVTNQHNGINKYNKEDIIHKYDEIYTENEDLRTTGKKLNLKTTDNKIGHVRNFDGKVRYGKIHRRYDGATTQGKRRVKREEDPCEPFLFRTTEQVQISHPRNKNNTDTYAGGVNCNTTIIGPDGTVIEFTFVDLFNIEEHPDCVYDYLEIRDGARGYSNELATLCGNQFPPQIVTTGPHAWLKFVSDDTIEYEGFTINIAFKQDPKSHKVPKECYQDPIKAKYGSIGKEKISQACKDESRGLPLDVLWTIIAPANMKIYLNFTTYELEYPNECEENLIQVFGSVLEYKSKLAHYCGSVANPVTTKDNIMYIRYFASVNAKNAKKTKFEVEFAAFRSIDTNKGEKCDTETEFDCEDNTCIAAELKCDTIAHCRLKVDEEEDLCKKESSSLLNLPHILAILVVFCLILTVMISIFLFKCIRKLCQDQKLIKKHLAQSCDDRLDNLVGSRLTLDIKRLQSDFEPRASLEKENHTNERMKRQGSFSKHKVSSMDSVFLPENPDPEDDPRRHSVDQAPVTDVQIEHNGRTRRSNTSMEETMRKSARESDDTREEETRDVSVGGPDMIESSCQTRDSLFLTGTVPSSVGSSSIGPRLSTFGYSGATVASPSPPPQTSTATITIELPSHVLPPQAPKPQKKVSDRRPMSAETTRSAPDVIIVAKPTQVISPR